jgi:uncharacterized protein
MSPNELFEWHLKEGAFERLNPPWQRFKVIERKGNIQNGGTIKVKIKIGGPLHTTWLLKHSDYMKDKLREFLSLGHILICSNNLDYLLVN